MKSATTLRWLIVLGLFPTFLFSQQALRFKLQLMPDGQTWGVYVKPDGSINPSELTTTGSAQVTVVMPLNFDWGSLESVSGTWISDAVVHGPIENPAKSYTSFGMVTEFPHINLVSGQETLLFTFKTGTDCPESIQLFENPTDPFHAPNSFGSNPGSEMTVFDPIGFGIYEYGGNYAPAAWDCHDNDNDDLLNAHEDTNGNGVFDAGTDASDLNAGNPALPIGCVKLKLQLLPDSSGWGVYARAFGDYSPSANAVATSGRVTVVAPVAMPFGDIESGGGDWSHTGTVQGATRKYLTFELSGSASSLALSASQDALLFQFDKLGDCPDSLYLLENYLPTGLQPNSFSGHDAGSFTSSGFDFCGVYARKAWRCATTGGGVIILPPVIATDSLGAPQPAATDRDADFPEGQIADGKNHFTASPNPAGDFVNIVVSGDLADSRPTLSLWDIQGKKRLEMVVENAATQLDLGGLPAGVYLVSLAQNGRMLQRELLVKH